MQEAVVDMDPISLIITSLDFKGAFPYTPHRLLQAVWKHVGLPFQGFLQAYLATCMYAMKTDVGTTMGPPRQWSPAKGCGRPILLPTRHPPAGVLHAAHIPGRGTIPPTDHAPGICR